MEDLITELGIEALEPERQLRIIDELNIRVGEAIMSGLAEEQITEYEAIINGDQAVISSWLASNDPGYADTIAYQQLAEGVESDPDKVPADKVYASMAWIEKNSPNLSETVAGIKADLKANLDQYT
ncbi:MAG: hypothetical protein JWO99_135 [Candidatus Saccharibacteria bacterium]|nr:hypothetical protein [Candidatus Saccharibacteria bacterium]